MSPIYVPSPWAILGSRPPSAPMEHIIEGVAVVRLDELLLWLVAHTHEPGRAE